MAAAFFILIWKWSAEVLQINGLLKIHPPAKVAVRHLDLKIGEGVFGLLGPNGAGKSSLMEVLAANLDFEEGTVTLDGSVDLRRHPAEWRSKLGYVPQSFDFPANLTGRELLRESAFLLGLQPGRLVGRIDALLERLNLTNAANREAAKYSRGMKQRLAIAMALLHDPRLLLLDEPTAGLDPVERTFFRNLLAEESSKRIVILSTHIVPDVERCCETVGVLAEGELRFHGTTEALAATAAGAVWQMRLSADELEEYSADGRLVSLVEKNGETLARVVSARQPRPDAVSINPKAEDAYINLLASLKANSSVS